MSKFIRKKTTSRNDKLDWVNTIVMIHNLQCECDKPLDHTIDVIYQQEPTLKLPKCHGGEDPITEEEGFGPGDLEALFADDTGENPADDTSTAR